MEIKMKFAILLASIGLTASAQHIPASQLPKQAQEFIKTHFKNAAITLAEKDIEMFDTDYKAVLSDGTEIEFDDKGSWEEIDGNHNALPASVLPKGVALYIDTNYKGQGTTQIDRKTWGYEVELANGNELEFDTAGKFLRIDN